MKTDHYIDKLINIEKQTEFNPYLITRIMSQIEIPIQKHVNRWQTVAVAASIAFAITLGIGLRNSYNSTSNSISGLVVNDSQIENFTLYNTVSNE